MKEDVDKILQETEKIAEQETAHLSDRRKEAAMHGRVTRHISIAEKDAAEGYYNKAGRYYDVDDGTEPYIRIFGMIFVYAIIALFINLILYMPINYLTRSWGEVNSHDAVYVTVIINTIISTILVGTISELTTKRKAFIAGMRAEADNHIVSKYHAAKDRVDRQYTDKGNLPDYDFNWNE